MSKTWFSSVAALLATAAFAVIPAAAQASETEPHYYTAEVKSSIIPEGERVPVVAFGTLTLKNVATGASVTCHYVVGGWVENPTGTSPETGHKGPAGIGATESFDGYECGGSPCTASTIAHTEYYFVEAEPASFRSPTEPGGNANQLEWRSVLKVDSTARRFQPTIRTQGYDRVNQHCHVKFLPEGEEYVTSEVDEGSLRPWTGTPHKGISPNYGFVEFDNPSEENGEGSGELHGPAGEETRKSKTEGRLQVVPYLKPGIINAKVG